MVLDVHPGDPHAGPPATTVAIGTESGVAIFDLETAARTRVYAGHASPVVSLAPSGDGRWLASSSIDQTVLLYPLEGCHARAPLGADMQPGPGGAWTVKAIDRRSFAAAMGLSPGDVLVQVGTASTAEGARYYNTPAEIDTFFGILPTREPYLYTIGFKVRRTTLIPTIGPVTFEALLPTTRRHNPTLALFLGADREWVFWTPQGYYDTSIEGDARFLGWHINPPFRTTRPTDFVPIGTFAEVMNRRDILDRLWNTGVLDQAANAPAAAPVPAPRRPSRRGRQRWSPPRTSRRRSCCLPSREVLHSRRPGCSGRCPNRPSGSRSGSHRAVSPRSGGGGSFSTSNRYRATRVSDPWASSTRKCR